MSDRYAREYLCPDPEEHGEIVYRPGILRYQWREGRYKWIAMADVPTCPLCGAEMVHDTDDRHVEVARSAVGAAERDPSAPGDRQATHGHGGFSGPHRRPEDNVRDIGHPAGRWSDENRLGAGSGRDRREGWALRPVNRPALRWLYDHGAHWTEQTGDALARPWMRLSRWCYRRWLEVR
jgi:hypothetical protein